MNLSRTILFFALIWNLAGAAPTHAPLPLKRPLQDKNFYLLSAMERSPEVRALIQSDATLARIGKAKRAALAEAPRTCAADVPCYARGMRWSDEEIAQAGAALAALGKQAAMSRFVNDVLLASGVFQRYSQKPAPDLLETAWQDAAHKMNRVIDIFALGELPRFAGRPAAAPAAQAPRFPRFELTAYDVKAPNFARMVQIMAGIIDSETLELFFEPSLRFSVELLELHSHDDAARHEPLEAGENRAAVARIRSIDWTQYPYTVLLVLGNGPERPGVALAPVGRLRLMVAVREFRARKAPFIIVSGGYVNPNLTPYSEAMEMKKALLKESGIPEEAILVDPHARRTTSNLRNGARLIYRYGIPFDRKGLIVSDQLHIASIETPAFRDRCVREFGFEPVRLISRISPFDLEFVPLIDSLHVDASDSLDP